MTEGSELDLAAMGVHGSMALDLDEPILGCGFWHLDITCGP
jgi:hypothetical protein